MRYQTEYANLRTTARAIRRSRTLAQQQAIARTGVSPSTGNWWPFWREWTHMTDPIAAIMTRFTSATGKLHGSKTSARKKASSPVNGRLGARYGIRGARYGYLGPIARARKQQERSA